MMVDRRDGGGLTLTPGSRGEGERVSTMSNREFLRALSKGHDGIVWVAAFTADPGSAQARWGGRAVFKAGDVPKEGANTYFSVGTVRTMDGGRRKGNIAAVTALVLDDVGTDDLTKLPVEASWILETSPLNHQVGYALRPNENLALLDVLLNGLIAQGRLSADKSGNNLIRYCRLPVGVNTKTTVVAATGVPFPHRLIECRLERRFSAEDLALAFSVSLTGSDGGIFAPAGRSPVRDCELREQLIACNAFHGPLTRLAARLAGRQMPAGDIEAVLVGLMDEAARNLSAGRQADWEARRIAIPRYVNAAVAKFSDPRERGEPAPLVASPVGVGTEKIHPGAG